MDEEREEQSAQAAGSPRDAARQVLCSQGAAPMLLDQFSDAQIAELAALSGDEEVAVKFAAWMDDYRESKKA